MIGDRQIIPAADLPQRPAGRLDSVIGVARPGGGLANFKLSELPPSDRVRSELDALLDGQQGGVIAESSWARLISVEPGLSAPIGTGADISPDTDAGSHVDPVKDGSQVVPNAGRFVRRSVSADGWEWLTASTLTSKASKIELQDGLGTKTDALPWRHRSTGRRFIHAVMYENRHAIFAVDRDGRAHVKSVELVSNGLRHRSTRGMLWSVGDQENKLLIGVDENGHAHFRPSRALLDFIANAIGTGLLPAVRGVLDPRDVRASADITRALTVQGGWSGEVQQPREGAALVAVAASLHPVVGVHHYGQSNSGGGGAAVAVLKDPLFIHHAHTFTSDKQQYGDTVVDPSTLVDLKPLADDSLRPFPGVTTAFALEALARAHGEASPASFSRTDWQGSMPLGAFMRGTSNWSNLMASIGRAIEVYRVYGRNYQPHVVWVQGEAGPDGRASYAAQLNALIDDARAEVRTNHQKELPWLVWQICYGQAVTRGVTLAHRDVVQSRPKSNTVLVAPTYSMPFVNLEGDVIHYSTLGRMIQGELTALALRAIERTGTWRTLDVLKITRTGASIVVDLHNPGGPIAIDTDWIEAIANYGFSYSDSNGSASVAQVSISGPSQLTITLSAVPTGTSKLLRYGLVAQEPVDAKWSAYRGQVYAPSGERSPFAALGYALPSQIRYYLPIFEETIA